MSTLKLLDFDSTDLNKPRRVVGKENLAANYESDDVPVHLFVSPTHSSTSAPQSPPSKIKGREKPFLRETTFVTIENQVPSDGSDREDGASLLSSPTLTNSGPDDLSSPTALTKLSSKRTNKIHDIDHNGTSRLAIREGTQRRSFGGETPRTSDALRSATSMSDHVSDQQSYKERLRDHFASMRERAAESVSRPQSRSQSRSQSRMKLLLATRPARPEESLKREERDVAAALDRRQKLRDQWRQLSHEIIEKNLEREGHEFFSLDDNADREAVAVNSELPTSPSTSSKSTDVKATVAEVLDLDEELEPIVWAAPKIVAPTTTLMKDIICYTPAKTVPLEEKLEEGSQPRFLEEEGFYVGDADTRPKGMKKRLELRLLREKNGKKWFGPDGEFFSRPIPLEFNLEIHQPPPERGVIYQYPSLHGKEDALDDTHMVLDLDLIAVRFTHHSLFSREHVMAQRLRELWRRYRQLRQINYCQCLRGQLEALRRARETQEGDTTETVKRLDADIKEVRDRWFAEGARERELESNLLANWRDLTRMRDEQGYRNTSVQLVVRQKGIFAEEEWEKNVVNEIAATYTEAFREYEMLREDYETKLETWQKKTSAGTSEDIEPVEEENPPRPPTPVDEIVIRHDVTAKFRASFNGPGDIINEFNLTDMGPPTSAGGDAKEESRRTAVQRQQVLIKLLYNGKEVCRSQEQLLNQKFSVQFGQRFAIRLQEWPQSLCLELTETGHNPCRIYLPFPDSLTTVPAAEVLLQEFSNAEVVSFSHTAVGSGKDIVPCPGSTENNRPICLYTSGTVTCRLGWAVDSNGKILAPPRKFWNFVRKNEVGTTKKRPDLNKLREWAEQARLDPHDPGNADLFNWLTQSENITPVDTNNQDELDFCDSSVIENNTRLRLLRLRDQGEPEFRGYQMVPLSEKLIHPDVFKAYEARVARPLEQEVVVDALDSHRMWGKRRLEQVRQEVNQRCRQARQHRRLADIVTEDQVPDLGTLGLTLMRWLRPKRPLRPERKQRKKVPVQHLIGQDVNIVVNVVRAFEVPVRKDMDTMSPTNDSIDGFSLVNVRPFVSATFRGFTARTTAAEGANPTWNQHLTLPVRTSTGDFSPGVLAGIHDTLYLHLFDEVIVDLVEEDTMRDSVIHQRLERHWLAALEIPFSTLYCNSRLEGTFQLYSPPVLLGYEREAHRTGEGSSLPQRDATYITLFITVQPSLNPPEPFQDIFSSTETPALERHLRGWETEVKSLFPTRKVRLLVSTANGTAVCITRYLRPIAPPSLGPSEPTAAALARFVARIPAMSSATFFPGLLDVWLTSDQVLSMLSGDVADHAVLLCCFLLHIGLPAYLLLGVGIPHGDTSYVLINSPGATIIWDPILGRKYNVKDSFCPLQKVFCLVNNTNIWANIQEDESPRRVRYDVSKRADWLPAFNKNMEAPIESIQPETLEFKETSRQAVQALQDKLESRLRDGVMKWRRRQRTQWNRYCAATMRKLLPRLEETSWDDSEPVSPEHWQGLNHILASHKICGFPINMAYTDIEAVMEAVKATGVHTNDTAEVEFSLAVYIHPYPCDVLSVWVYIASLIRRR